MNYNLTHTTTASSPSQIFNKSLFGIDARNILLLLYNMYCTNFNLEQMYIQIILTTVNHHLHVAVKNYFSNMGSISFYSSHSMLYNSNLLTLRSSKYQQSLQKKKKKKNRNDVHFTIHSPKKK